MTRINWLRTLFIVSSACYALYYYLFPAEPLWLDIISEGAFVVVNIIMLAYVYWLHQRVRLNENEQHLYDSHFNSVPLHDFFKLIKCTRWEILEEGAVLIKRSEQVDDLYYLFSGEALVDLNRGDTVVRSAGSVFGELSYSTSNPAVATVTISNRSILAAWNQKTLQKLCRSNDKVSSAISSLLSSQMANKLS